MADRVAHNVNPINGIGKLLSEGRVVLCDRYYYSSLAYQGTVTDPEWVFRINIDCPEIRKPDLCVFLDLDDEECLAPHGAGGGLTARSTRTKIPCSPCAGGIMRSSGGWSIGTGSAS